MIEIPGFFTYDTKGRGDEVRPGRYSAVFVNMKKTWSRPDIISSTAEKLADLCRDSECIIGIESGGSPYASLVASILKTNLVLARREAKTQGGHLAGYISDAEKKFAVVDDVLATGESSERGSLVVNHGENQIRIVSILSYGMDTFIAQKYGVEVTSLYQIDDILDCLDPDLQTELTPYVRAYQEKIHRMIILGKYTDKDYESKR